ncbi:MAG: hypothetical protein HC795_14740 [Coleofasciculaceae cyanobacterium RL_1_1]|nr:hypothetical protein [Coleofasciculaceae cyanobacterium RL_1_1]
MIGTDIHARSFTPSDNLPPWNALNRRNISTMSRLRRSTSPSVYTSHRIRPPHPVLSSLS